MGVGLFARQRKNRFVVVKIAKFTFSLPFGARARMVGKRVGVGRITNVMRPNVGFGGLFWIVLGMLARLFLDA